MSSRVPAAFFDYKTMTFFPTLGYQCKKVQECE